MLQTRQAKQGMSALQYRMNARNALTGRTHLAVAYPGASQVNSGPGEKALKRNSAPADVSMVGVPKLLFASQEYRVLESQKSLRLMVHCDRCVCGCRPRVCRPFLDSMFLSCWTCLCCTSFFASFHSITIAAELHDCG